jgi:hypothetical protein
MSDMNETSKVSLHRYGPAAGLLGGLGILALLAGAFLAKDPAAWQAYLFGWVAWTSLSIGCLGLMLLKHSLNAKWGLPVLRLMEASASVTNFIILFLTFLPILYTVLSGNPVLYLWADHARVEADHALHAKPWFLNPTGYAIRTLIYFAIFIFFARKLSSSTIRQDASGDTREQQMRTNWASFGLVVFMLTVTAAFTDWVMSLEPHWSSTMYGAWWAVGAALGALAFLTITATLNADREPYQGVVTHSWTRDMGNLMFTFTMLWGYTTFSQYLIIWSGNLPEFVTYFVRRSEGRWNAIGLAVMLGQFFVPFFSLLSPRVKAQPQLLVKICGWILVFRLVDMYYVIMPAMRPTPMPSFWDIVALAGLGGLWAYGFSRAVAKAPLMPTYDPRLMEAAHAH